MKIKNFISYLLTLSMVFVLFGGVGHAEIDNIEDYAQDKLSRSASGVSVFDSEIDPKDEERAEVEVILRDVNRNWINEDVFFYVESNREEGEVNLYYHDVEDHEVCYLGDGVWLVMTDHEHSNFDGKGISFWVESQLEGDINLELSKDYREGKIGKLFGNRYTEGEITIRVLEYEPEHYELKTPAEPIRAGRSYMIGAVITEDEDRDFPVRGVEVNFYERKEGDRRWREIGKDITDRRGLAEIRVNNDEMGSYEYTASTREISRGYEVGSVSVAASYPSDIEALDREINLEKGRENIFFKMTDRYENINKDIAGGVKNYRDYSSKELEGFDYTERLIVKVTDPEGEIKVLEKEDIRYSSREEAMYVRVNFNEFGEWELEGRITNTSISARTVVNVKEFESLYDIEIELDNQVMRNFDQGTSSYNFDLYEGEKLNVYLVDENDVRLSYDPGDEFIRFSSSNTRVAGIDTWEGIIFPRRTGETVLTAFHMEEDIEKSITLFISHEPVDIEIIEDIEAGELKGEVKMTMVDEDGVRALPGVFETYREDGRTEVESFRDSGGYDLLVPAGLTISEEKDFEDGIATFFVEADDYEEYSVTVYGDTGISKKFGLNFVEDIEETEKTTLALTIGKKDYTINEEVFDFGDVEPFIHNDRSYLPIRAIMEAFGAEVVFVNETRTITVEAGERLSVFTLDETMYTVNGEEKNMDTAPYLDETAGRAYLPIRYFGEDSLGAEVNWDPALEQVTIIY